MILANRHNRRLIDLQYYGSTLSFVATKSPKYSAIIERNFSKQLIGIVLLYRANLTFVIDYIMNKVTL